MFEDRIYTRYSNLAAERVASEVIVGVSYTLVALDDGSVGVASSPRRRAAYDGPRARRRELRSRGRYADQSGLNLLSLVLAEDPVDRAVGFATTNALAASLDPRGVEGNLADLLPDDGGRRLLTFGYFRPIEERLRRRGFELHHVELEPGEHPDRVDPGQLDAAMAEADWVIASGETLVNGSFSEIVGRLPEGGQLVLLGPSTPLDPSLFCHLPVRALSGIRVTEPERFRAIIREGGATPDMADVTAKHTLWIA